LMIEPTSGNNGISQSLSYIYTLLTGMNPCNGSGITISAD